MSREFFFSIAAVLALPGLLAGPAFAQATADTAAAAEAAADTAEAAADVAQDAATEAQATADMTQSAADAQTAADAQNEAEAAQEAAIAADAAAADEAAAASAFRGGIRSVRILKNLSQEHRAETIVGDDTLGEVTSIRMDFEGASDSTVVAPAPLKSSYTLNRTVTGYDAAGKLLIAADGAGQPIWDEPYDLTFTLTDSSGVTSSPVVLGGVPVGDFYEVTGTPVIFGGTAYLLESVDWSGSPDCYGCPIISLVDLVDDSDVVGLDSIPLQVSLTATPTSTVIVDGFEASFESFATTATFTDDTIAFDADAVGFEYAVTASMFAGDLPVGEPAQFLVLVEEDDTLEPEPLPVPTLVIDTNLSGSVSVGDGEYVVLQAQVGKNITVKKGGTLLIQGGVVGRDLKLNGGEVILADATIGRSLKAKGGIIEVGEAVIGRDLEIKGGVEVLGDSQSFLVIGRDLKGRTSDSVVLGGNLEVLNRVHLRAGDLIVNDTLSAEGDIDLRTRGNTDGGLVIHGDITAGSGEIEMRTKGSGGLSINGSLTADGAVNLRTRRDGDLNVAGAVSTLGEISMLVRGDADLTISGDVTAVGDIDIRVRDGGVVIDGSVLSDSVIDLDSDTTTDINGTLWAQADIYLDSGGATDVDGTVTALGNIDLTAATDLTVHGTVVASVTPGDTFGFSSVTIHVRNTAIRGSVSGSGDVEINATDAFELEGGLVESTGGSVTVLARGIVGTWSFDDSAGQDTSGYMSIQAANNVTLDAVETLDLVGAAVVADQGSVSLTGDACTASWGIDDVEIGPVLMVVSGGAGVEIDVAETLELTGAQIDSSGGSINIQARGIVGRWGFDDYPVQDTSGYMSIQAANNVTIDAVETLDLVGATVVADQGSVSLTAEACEASWGIDDVEIGPILTVISGGGGVEIDVAETLEMGGVMVESGGDIDIFAAFFRRSRGVPLDIPDCDFDATDAIIIEGGDHFELFGTFRWGEGAFCTNVAPTQVFDSGGMVRFDPLTGSLSGSTLPDPDALLACVAGE